MMLLCEQSHLVIIRGTVEQIIDVNLNPLLAKASIISTELIPIHTMDEGEVLIIKYLS